MMILIAFWLMKTHFVALKTRTHSCSVFLDVLFNKRVLTTSNFLYAVGYRFGKAPMDFIFFQTKQGELLRMKVGWFVGDREINSVKIFSFIQKIVFLI